MSAPRLPPRLSREVLAFATEHGFSWGITGGGHIRFVHPDSPIVVHTSASPSDGRATANAISDLRRALRARGTRQEAE